MLVGWTEPVNLDKAEYAIQTGVEGTGLEWRGWRAFRSGIATNLAELGVDARVIALILANSDGVCRAHYIKTQQDRDRVAALNKLERAFEQAEGRLQ